MLHSSPNTSHPRPYKPTPLFNFLKRGMPFVLTYANLFQQTRSGHHKRNSNQKITSSLNFSYQQILILNISEQNKNLKNSQEQSEFILLKTPPYHHQKNQNHMSISLITCNITMNLNFLLQLYSP